MRILDRRLLVLSVAMFALMVLIYNKVSSYNPINTIMVIKKIENIKNMSETLNEFAGGIQMSVEMQTNWLGESEPLDEERYLYNLNRLGEIIEDQTMCINKEANEAIKLLKGVMFNSGEGRAIKR